MDNAILRSTTDEVLSKLLTVDDAKERLAPTEGLAEYEFATDGNTNKVTFDFPDSWNDGIENLEDFAVTSATIDIDGTQLPLTKAGALDLASEVSVSKGLASRVPGSYITPIMNYEYSHGANNKKSLKILASDVGALAVTRGTVVPFSGSRLLDAIVEGVGTRYDTTDLRVDYKYNHSLELTNLRLIIPSATRNIASARAAKSGDDPWSLGLELTNSIEGKKSLEIKGYLFAWWCTNGATIERASSGRYRRKPSLTPDDAYEWAQHITDDVFNDLDREFDAIQQLTQVPLDGEMTQTVGRMFERFDVPDSTRDLVIDNLMESDDLTAYGLMNAVTAAANTEGMSSGNVNALLRAGGEIAHGLSDRCDVCHRF